MNNSDKYITYIDIEKIITDSNSKFLKKIPRFLIKLITRIIQQDELNRILNKYSDYEGIDFLPKMIEEFNLELQIEGKENLPENGKCFFVANHPFGIIDGLIITRIVSEKYGPLKAIGNDAFAFIPQLRPLIATVNVFRQSSKEYVKALDETFKSDIPITHFPAGEVSRRYKWKVEDTVWQKSFISKSIANQRDIVPIFFYGKNSPLFYFIHRIRRIFGIKLFIELILLPREMFKKRNKKIKVRIGKPISYKMFDHSLTHNNWAKKVRSLVYELGSSNYNN